jgi:hypothetical protein
MKDHLRPIVAVLFLGLVVVSAHSQDKGAAPAAAAASVVQTDKPISQLAWLTGGVWTADASKMAPGLRIETRYQWSDNGSYIRFTTHFITDKTTMKTYDGNFFWSPAQKTLSMWYMDARNDITEGPVKVSGDSEVMFFDGEDFEGKQASLKVEVLRKSPDLYEWILTEKDGDSWKPLASLEYVRKAGA